MAREVESSLHVERTNWRSEQGYNFIKLVIGLFKNIKAVAHIIVSFPNHSCSKTRVQLTSDLKFCMCGPWNVQAPL